MALYDPGPLLAFIASFISLVGNFFAILFATYDTDAFWTERYLSGNTQDYYWHIFCWSLDEYDRARAFCWIFAIGVVVVLYFTVGSCRGSGRHAVERRARESRFEERSKAYEAEIKGLKEQVATHDGATEALKNRIDVLENDLTGAEEKISDLKKDLTGAKDKILDLGKELEASEKATKTALHDFDYQKDLVETQRRDLENQKTELENQRKQFGDQKEQLKSKETKLEAQPKATTTQKDLVNKLRGEKIEADKIATARCNRLNQTLLEVREELKTEEENGRKARAAVKTAEEAAGQAKAEAKKASDNARRLDRRFNDEQKRSQGLEQDLERERQNAKDAAEAAKKQYESEYANQATRCEDKIRDQQITAANQAAERQKEHDTELKALHAVIDAAEKQKRIDGDELEKAINETSELQRHSDKAAEDAAEGIEQLQKQNSEHTDLQHEVQRTRSENESLLKELRTAKTAAKQLKELQGKHSAQGETMNALESQVQALKNKIESIENRPSQHHNNGAKGAAHTNMAWTQTSLSKYSQAASENYDEDYYPRVPTEIEENFQTAVDIYAEVNDAASQEPIVNLAVYAQEYEDTARPEEEETTANLADVEQHYDGAASQETTANLANVGVCKYDMQGCRYRLRGCPYQHTNICGRMYCREEGRTCPKLHLKKKLTKVCASWSTSGQCGPHTERRCKLSHPAFCGSWKQGRRCYNERCESFHPLPPQ